MQPQSSAPQKALCHKTVKAAPGTSLLPQPVAATEADPNGGSCRNGSITTSPQPAAISVTARSCPRGAARWPFLPQPIASVNTAAGAVPQEVSIVAATSLPPAAPQRQCLRKSQLHQEGLPTLMCGPDVGRGPTVFKLAHDVT